LKPFLFIYETIIKGGMPVESTNVDLVLLTLVYYEVKFVYANVTEDNFVLKEPNYLGIHMLINTENCKTFADFFEVQRNILKIFTLFGSKNRHNIIMNHPLNTLDSVVYARVEAYLTTETLNYHHISFLKTYDYTNVSKHHIRFIQPFIGYTAHLIKEYNEAYQQHKRKKTEQSCFISSAFGAPAPPQQSNLGQGMFGAPPPQSTFGQRGGFDFGSLPQQSTFGASAPREPSPVQVLRSSSIGNLASDDSKQPTFRFL
jgi:hypothetical protein